VTERLEDVREHIRAVGQLGVVVSAMRGIAAARAQQSRALLPGIAAYASVVAQGVSQALRLGAADRAAARRLASGLTTLVLFTAEHGFVGTFSDVVLDAAKKHDGRIALFVVGARGARRAAERGQVPDWQTRMASHPGSVAAAAAQVADALYEQIGHTPVASVAMIYPAWSAGSGLRVEERLLLPLDYRRFASLAKGDAPLVTLPPDELMEHLAAEYVFAQLCEAATHAFAAENEARAAAMVRAKSNIDDMLAELEEQQRRVRQEQITAEVIELASAAPELVRTSGPERTVR
jgi:F-type H+-transporting ATPase subunit gamma